MAHYILNEKQHGIEIYFELKPNENVIRELKERKWKWYPSKKCWYARQDETTLEFAENICKSVLGCNAPVVNPYEAAANLDSKCQAVSYNITLASQILSKVTISKIGTSYQVSSTNNQILCVDCHCLFSIHAPSCPFCGCPLTYSLKIEFDRFCQDQLESQERAEQQRTDKEQAKMQEEKQKRNVERLSHIQPEFLKYYESVMQENLSPQTISGEELALIESENLQYTTFSLRLDGTIREKCNDIIEAFWYGGEKTIPYREQRAITNYFRDKIEKGGNTASATFDPVQEAIIKAVEASLAHKEMEYTSLMQQFCQQAYSKYSGSKFEVIEHMSVAHLMEKDIDAIRSMTNKTCPKAVVCNQPDDIPKTVQNLDTVLYLDSSGRPTRVKVNVIKNPQQKCLLGLKEDDLFLDSNGLRCVLKEITQNNPYQGWKDLAPSLAVDSFPNHYGKKRKWIGI